MGGAAIIIQYDDSDSGLYRNTQDEIAKGSAGKVASESEVAIIIAASEAEIAFRDWKRAHPSKVLDGNAFYMVGEVSGYNISAGRLYDFGDRKVDFTTMALTRSSILG